MYLSNYHTEKLLQPVRCVKNEIVAFSPLVQLLYSLRCTYVSYNILFDSSYAL